MFDGLSAQAVRLLRPQAWVIPAWHIAHPDMLQMERMLSERMYPGARDVFSVGLTRENYLANRRLVTRMRSTTSGRPLSNTSRIVFSQSRSTFTWARPRARPE